MAHYLPSLDEINQAVADGLVSVQEHPQGGLFIYNYTKETQYEGKWNPVTIACRGLILNADGMVIARPFPKFFNWNEHSASDTLFSSPYSVTEKVDGSLGIYYTQPDGTPAIATRGSFISDQAFRATMILQEKYDHFKPHRGFTYLFEIIYPENKIVIDYGGLEDLVLIGVVNNATGNDHPQALRYSPWPGEIVKELRANESRNPESVLELGINDGTQEGYVLRFLHDGNHVRVKVKYSEYIRLHRIVTGLSTKVIWEFLKSEPDSLKELLQDVPDEFYSWAEQVARDIMVNYNMLYRSCEQTFAKLVDDVFKGEVPDPILSKHRKAFAQAVLDLDCDKFTRDAMFALLDNNVTRFKDQIWKQVCPDYAGPVAVQKEPEESLTNA